MNRINHIHFIAIGGIGMSGIARLFLEQGVKVSGCDVNTNSLTNSLAAAGACIQQGHCASHLDSSVGAVVFSSAIKQGQPELTQARLLEIPLYRRAQALALLMEGKRGIAVTGTHGKTTVSTMISHIMSQAGLDPSFVIGAEIPALGGNARWGKGDYFVAETDESDGSQVHIRPQIAVLTNLDRDHLEYYSREELLIEKMETFVNQLPVNGLLVAWGEDARIREIITRIKKPFLTYGLGADNDIYATDIKLAPWESLFNIWCQDKCLGRLKLNLPGKHNILNTLAAAAVALKAGVSFTAIQAAVTNYPRIKRRLEILVANEAITVIDDYAHHPAEIEAVIAAATEFKKGRLLGVFQPHRFTRTKFFYPEFAPSFRGLDLLLLTDIYGAGEPALPGVDGRLIYQEVLKQGEPACVYLPALTDIPGYLLKNLRPEDTVIFLGAGTITDIAWRFKELAEECVKKLTGVSL